MRGWGYEVVIPGTISEVFRWTVLGNKTPFPEAYKRIKALNLGLAPIRETEVEILEIGRNECALGPLLGP